VGVTSITTTTTTVYAGISPFCLGVLPAARCCFATASHVRMTRWLGLVVLSSSIFAADITPPVISLDLEQAQVCAEFPFFLLLPTVCD
jgi:hypothetical protein